MSTTEDAHSAAVAGLLRTRETPRILEDTGQWFLLGHEDRRLGTFENLSVHPFSFKVRGEDLAGVVYRADFLYFEFSLTMKLLEGQRMQALIGPNYAFIAGHPLPPYSPRGGIAGVALALISATPAEMGLEEAVLLLHKWCS